MILMLMARVGGLEGIGAGVYFQDQIDDFFQRRVVDARSFVDAITGVKANLLGRDAAQGVIDRVNRPFGDLAPLGGAQRWILAVNFGEPGIVDLQNKAGIDDREIFLAQSIADRVRGILRRWP